MAQNPEFDILRHTEKQLEGVRKAAAKAEDKTPFEKQIAGLEKKLQTLKEAA